MSVLTITVPEVTTARSSSSSVSTLLIDQLPKNSSKWIKRKISTIVFTPQKPQRSGFFCCATEEAVAVREPPSSSGSPRSLANPRFAISRTFIQALNEILQDAIKTVPLEHVVVEEGIDVIEGMLDRGFFDECTTLKSVRLPKKSLMATGHSFLYGCTCLTSLDLPDNLTSVLSGFLSACASLTMLNLPTGLTSAGDHFLAFCPSLTTLDLPDGLTSVGDCFLYGCTSLRSLNLPDSLTRVGRNFLEGCTSLTTLTTSSSPEALLRLSPHVGPALRFVNLPRGYRHGEPTPSYPTDRCFKDDDDKELRIDFAQLKVCYAPLTVGASSTAEDCISWAHFVAGRLPPLKPPPLSRAAIKETDDGGPTYLGTGAPSTAVAERAAEMAPMFEAHCRSLLNLSAQEEELVAQLQFAKALIQSLHKQGAKKRKQADAKRAEAATLSSNIREIAASIDQLRRKWLPYWRDEHGEAPYSHVKGIEDDDEHQRLREVMLSKHEVDELDRVVDGVIEPSSASAAAVSTSPIATGKHRSTGKRVVIKRVDIGGGGSQRRQFEREMRVLERLQLDPHPNLVSFVQGFVDVSGSPGYILSELADCDLREWLDSPKSAGASVRTLLSIIRDAARGLSRLHAHGILHRDLKERNVLISTTDLKGGSGLVAKLCDFNSTGGAEGSAAASGVTVTMTMHVTRGYIPPEILRDDKARWTTKGDVYQLGLVAEAVLEKMPKGATAASDASSIAALRELVNQMKDDDPSKRPSALSILSHRAFSSLDVALAVKGSASDLPPPSWCLFSPEEEDNGIRDRLDEDDNDAPSPPLRFIPLRADATPTAEGSTLLSAERPPARRTPFSSSAFGVRADGMLFRFLSTALTATCNSGTLNMGRDVKVKMPSDKRHTKLTLVKAERLENTVLWAKYAARRRELLEQARSRRGASAAAAAREPVPPPSLRASLPITTKLIDVAETMTKEDKNEHEEAIEAFYLGAELHDSVNECYLWHGTSPGVAADVMASGLDERFSQLTAPEEEGKMPAMFGGGLYFADHSSKADQYSTPDPPSDIVNGLYPVFLCRVVLGSRPSPLMQEARYGERLPPLMPVEGDSSSTSPTQQRYDSLIGQAEGAVYKEYVVYDRAQAYPEYLLWYKREQ